MHSDFAGDITPSRDTAAIGIHDHHVLRPHHPLAHGSGGAKNTVLIQTNGEVTVHGRHISAFVHHSAELDNLTPELTVANHVYCRIRQDNPKWVAIVPQRIDRNNANYTIITLSSSSVKRLWTGPIYHCLVLVSDFNYPLPEELIAQEPLADRSASRLLHVAPGGLQDNQFRSFPDLLRPDDLVVFNNTKVFPARLFGRRSGSKAQPVSAQNPASREFLQGKAEVLLTRRLSEEPNEWECLVRPGRKIGIGERLFFGEGNELQAEVLARGDFGERRIRFDPVIDFAGILERIGHVPLPPYINREDRSTDRERYQTVYARE